MIVTPIILLLYAGCPPAVFWAVRTIDIDAINRMSARRPEAHIGAECQEIVAPSVTYGDAATTVVRVRAISRIEAPRLQTKPRSVFRCRVSDRRRASVFVQALSPLFNREASTAALPLQRIGPDGQLDAAVAPTEPVFIAVRDRRRADGQHGEPSEPLTGQILPLRRQLEATAPRACPRAVPALSTLHLGRRSVERRAANSTQDGNSGSHAVIVHEQWGRWPTVDEVAKALEGR